jgi:bile acid:Na+ symporter, BASS family
MKKFLDAASRGCLTVAALAAVVVVVGVVTGRPAWWQPAAVLGCAGLAIGLRVSAALRPYQFTVWVMAAVVAGMAYPEALLIIGRDEQQKKWIMLLVIQLVMFGMGTQMSLRDLASMKDLSYAVVVGFMLQFTVMPLVGYGLATLSGLPPEIAAGVVLIGACSSGLASNVMNYLAGANLTLSVTLTAITTMMAPVMTPLWMKMLAGRMVEVSFVAMMIEILKVTIVPLAAALLDDYLKHASAAGRRVVMAMAAVGVGWLGFLALDGWSYLSSRLSEGTLTAVALFGFLLAAVVVGVAYHALAARWPGVSRVMPRFSMFGIVFFTAVTTAKGRDALLVVGWMLLAVAIVHNTLGYVLGYWLSRAFRMDKRSARTVSIEVGLQNGSMATGVAAALGMLGTMGLPAAIFSPWMNVSGSVLANYWRKRPVDEAQEGGASFT